MDYQGTTGSAEPKPIAPSQAWGDDYALDRVKQDFNFAENYRSMNHDWRWRNADELYLAWNQTKYWEGTRIPRSSLGIFVALEQVESLLPKLISTVFADGENWFQAAPMPTTTYDQARGVRDLMAFYLNGSHTRPQERVREVFRRSAKSALIYGNGIVELGWREYVESRRKLVRDIRPKTRSFDLRALGIDDTMQIPIPGEFVSSVHEIKFLDQISEPFIRNVSLKDFYIDPNCRSPIVQEGRYAILRSYMTVDELDRLRDSYKFNIPSIEYLVECSEHKPAAQADWTKASTETMRSGSWNPQIDQTSDPRGKRCEVLAYWTRDRLVWVIGRKRTILNIANPYGFIPFYNWYYVDVIDRFYGLAVTDVVEGEQRLIASTINARVDELSLSIHRPMIKRRGLQVPAYQLRRRPGQLIEAENPKEDIIMEQQQNITQQAYIEVDAAERRVQKYTGVTDLAFSGSPGGGNSASRTATGVSTQAQAAFSRVQYLVENAEDTFIEPLLAGMLQITQKFIDPEKKLQILGEEGDSVEVDPLDVINSEVKFSMRASAKMQSRNFLLQTFPLIGQTILNPEFLSMLAQQQQMTIDVHELGMLLGDATGYQMDRGIFRKMTPEEMQSMNQPPPEAMVKSEMQDKKLTAQAQMKQMDLEGKHDSEESQAMYDMAHTTLEKGLEAQFEDDTRGTKPAAKRK